MNEDKQELLTITEMARKLIREGNYQQCEQLILNAMIKYPHAPQPHNLFGVLLETKHNHLLAMKHFLVACSLDPTYVPAKFNLEFFSTGVRSLMGAFNEVDCQGLNVNPTYVINYKKLGDMHVRGERSL